MVLWIRWWSLKNFAIFAPSSRSLRDIRAHSRFKILSFILKIKIYYKIKPRRGEIIIEIKNKSIMSPVGATF